MSDATYRIVAKITVGEPWPWWASIFGPDGMYVNGCGGESADEAIALAKSWCDNYERDEGIEVLYTPPGHSVKA